MDWDTFWVPQLTQWIVGGAITAIVSATVGLIARYYLKRIFQQIAGEQIQTRHAAEAAATRAGEAVTESKNAARHADTAQDNSRQTAAAVEWLAGEYAKSNTRAEYLAKLTDDLVGLVARQKRRHPEDFPAEPEPFDPTTPPAGDTDYAITITGRHRLHTAMIATHEQDTV